MSSDKYDQRPSFRSLLQHAEYIPSCVDGGALNLYNVSIIMFPTSMYKIIPRRVGGSRTNPKWEWTVPRGVPWPWSGVGYS